ncbi:MAG TPA: hypothetical protein PLO57_05920 [Candidatus Cloacimonadota bacterium]|nr:hypothetical protein [Candidatus Cloacimonadota bacterium]
MAEQNSELYALQPKRIGCLLLLGILFVPYVFVWFLLKPGYKKTARILGFSWLIIVLLIIIIPGKGGNEPAAGVKSVVEKPSIESDSTIVDTPTTIPEAKVVAVLLEDMMPQKQKNLIEVLKKAWEKSEYDYTEAEKYKLIKERKNSISNGYQMTDWVGTVFDAQFHQDANEISLVIVLYQGNDLYETIQVGTGTSADPKHRAPTTIKEGSSLFDLALELKSDDKVRFSGILYLRDYSPWSAKRADDNPLDSFGQQSFLTKFSKIEKIE